MKPLFEVKPVDREFYAKRLRDWLPDKIIDIHTHVWLDRFKDKRGNEPVRSVTWPARVAKDCSIEDLVETYRVMFPDKAVTPLIFGNVFAERDDRAGNNRYVAESAVKANCPALICSHPEWPAEELEARIAQGKFVGAKSYLTLAPTYLPEKEIRIYDYFPHAHLDVLNRRGWILMLHIPRDGRLRDPVNLAQLLEIEARYPRLRVVIAHVGRAYCPEDVGNAFKVLSKTRNMCFDISANTNALVFRQLIEAVGPKRILFGSDLVIARMRMRRICERGNYVNIVPAGLYGDVSGDKHMREVSGIEADKLSFFMFEIINAFRRAAEETGLTRSDVEDVYFNNAGRMLRGARGGAKYRTVQEPKEKATAKCGRKT